MISVLELVKTKWGLLLVNVTLNFDKCTMVMLMLGEAEWRVYRDYLSHPCNFYVNWKIYSFFKLKKSLSNYCIVNELVTGYVSVYLLVVH